MRAGWLSLGAGWMLALPLWAMGANPGSGVAVPVVWKEQRLNFVYMGRTSRYSCDGLRDKMLALLMDFGARRDLSVTAQNCEPTAAPQRITGSSFNVVFASPAMPDGAAEKPAHTGDPAAVEARFEKFMLTNDAFRNLGIADCELVEEFARQILPKLAVRNVRQDFGCVPYQESASHFWVRGEVLKVLSRS